MKQIGIFLLAIFLINASFKPAQETEKAKVYEYVSISVTSMSKPDLYITESGGNFERIKVRGDQSRDWYDNAEVFKLLNKYEKDGYELFSTNNAEYGTTIAEVYLLRREKKM